MNTYFGRTIAESHVEVVRRLTSLLKFHRAQIKRHDAHKVVQESLLHLKIWHHEVTRGLDALTLDNIIEDYIKSEVFKRIIDALYATQELFDYFELHSRVEKKDLDPKISVDALKRSVDGLRAISEDVQSALSVPDLEQSHNTEEVVQSEESFTDTLRRKLRRRHDDNVQTGSEAASDDGAQASTGKLPLFHPAYRTFGDVRDSLIEKFPTENEHDSEIIFVPRFAVRDIFCAYPDDVKSLYVLASSEDQEDRSTRAERAERFYHAIIGRSGGVEDDDSTMPEERGLSVVLAMFLWQNISPTDKPWKLLEGICISGDSVSPPIKDASLPMAKEALQTRFGNERFVKRLEQVQYTFRPVILEKNKFKRAHRKHLMPYLKPPEKCGSGSVGTVYKCVIPRGHIESRNGVNKQAVTLARKDFLANAQGEQAAKLERLIHEKFMLSSVTRHRHIMKPIASLLHGSNVSFFFDLARCDLLEYMKRGPNGDGSAPDNNEKKLQILQQFIHLASALEYLHNGIQAPGYDRVICYHLDLKPQNILVVPSEDPAVGDVFKISDFGISRVHYVQGSRKAKVSPGGESGIEISPYDSTNAKSLREERTLSELHQSSTYIAPEGMADSPRVSTSSDVWAFGCILCTLLSWLHGGWPGVEKFSDQRKDKEGSHRDYFFSSKPVQDSTACAGSYTNKVFEEGQTIRRAYELNPAVNALFDDSDGLIRSCVSESKQQKMYKDIWVLLQKHLLKVDPDRRRIRMDTVRQRLAKISGAIDQFELAACQPQ